MFSSASQVATEFLGSANRERISIQAAVHQMFLNTQYLTITDILIMSDLLLSCIFKARQYFQSNHLRFIVELAVHQTV